MNKSIMPLIENQDGYFHKSLNPHNFSKEGYYWIHDILFDDSPIYGTLIVFHELFKRGYRLGKAKKIGDKIYGFYVPKEIANERLSNIFFPTLTPDNAKEREYEYVGDIIYNILSPNEEIIDLIKNRGYKLGISIQDDTIDSYFGLYMPL